MPLLIERFTPSTKVNNRQNFEKVPDPHLHDGFEETFNLLPTNLSKVKSSNVLLFLYLTNILTRSDAVQEWGDPGLYHPNPIQLSIFYAFMQKKITKLQQIFLQIFIIICRKCVSRC